MTLHPPGAIVLCVVPGWEGALVDFLLILNEEYGHYNHCGVVDSTGDGMIEERPGGARRTAFVDIPYQYIVFAPTYPYEGMAIAKTAESLIGTPYSFLDYVSMALLRLHIRPQFIVDAVASTKHWTCSGFVDYCWSQHGKLFTDGRYIGDVTPGGLWSLIHQQNWKEV